MKRGLTNLLWCLTGLAMVVSHPALCDTDYDPSARIAQTSSFDAEWLQRISRPEVRRELVNDLDAIARSTPLDGLALQQRLLDRLLTNGVPRSAEAVGWGPPSSAFPSMAVVTNLDLIIGTGAASEFAVAWLWWVPSSGGIRQTVDRAASRALVQLGPRSLPALYRVLSADSGQDGDGWKRHRLRTVCMTISAIADTNSLPVLLAHMRTRTTGYSQDEVTDWLKNFGFAGLPQAIANLETDDAAIRNACWIAVTEMTGQAPTRRRLHADDNPAIPEHASLRVGAWWARSTRLPFFQQTRQTVLGPPTNGAAIVAPNAECAVNGTWGLHFSIALVDGRQRADIVMPSYHVDVVKPDGSSTRLIPSEPKMTFEAFAYRPPLAPTDSYCSHTVFPSSKWFQTETGHDSQESFAAEGVYKVRLCGHVADKGSGDQQAFLIGPWVSVRIVDSLAWTNAP